MLLKGADWTFTTGARDADTRHLLLAAEWARSHSGGQLGEGCSESAEAAYGAYVKAGSKDSLKALAELRKTVVDEAQKASQKAQDMAGAMWKDLAVATTPFVIKVLPDSEKTANQWFRLVVRNRGRALSHILDRRAVVPQLAILRHAGQIESGLEAKVEPGAVAAGDFGIQRHPDHRKHEGLWACPQCNLDSVSLAGGRSLGLRLLSIRARQFYRRGIACSDGCEPAGGRAGIAADAITKRPPAKFHTPLQAPWLPQDPWGLLRVSESRRCCG